MVEKNSAKKSTSARGKPVSQAKLKSAREADVGGRAAWAALASSVEGHGSDAGGMILGGLGLLSALGTYANLTGLFGHAIKWTTSAAVGWGHIFVPIALLVVGGVVLSGRFPYGYAPRLFFGSLLIVVSVTGLADLIQGAPGINAPVKDLQHAGGYVGALARGPVSAVLGSLGAGIVLFMLLFFAILVTTSTSIGQLANGIRFLSSHAWYYLQLAGRSLTTLNQDDEEEDGDAAMNTPIRKPPRHAVAFQGGPIIDLPVDGESFTRSPVLADFEVDVDEPYLDDSGDDESYRDLEDDEEEDEDEVDTPTFSTPAHVEQLTIDLGEVAAPTNWKLPPASSLKRTTSKELDQRIVEERGHALEAALRSHGVETRLVGMTVGPTVTRYELELGAGVKVARVTSLNKDIAYAMAAEDVRILAPIPGRSAIGVEVPNRDRQLVSLGDCLVSEEAKKAKHPLEVAVGRDINGRAAMLNLAETPHLLIAGATGAGKSSCVNSMLTSILMRSTPDQVRMILVDPKRVELGQYNGLPHLLTQVVVNPKKAANALQWAVREMDRRYDLLSEVGVRDITGYNQSWDRGDFMAAQDADEEEVDEEEVDEELEAEFEEEEESEDEESEDEEDEDDEELEAEYEDGEEDEESEDEEDEDEDEEEEIDLDEPTRVRARPDGSAYERLPFIVIVVDELNDLMMVAARDVEESICRIAQMARAVGIHLVIATQRPSVDVITGVIKANIPSRLAFAVSTLADSRVILDQPGAERLVGKGDLLLVTASSSIARRIQGPWVGEDEVRKVVAHWKRQSGSRYVAGIEGEENPNGLMMSSGSDDGDELLEQAIELVVRAQMGSTSMLQRKLRVGFARAGRLMDLLESRGIVGPSEGSRARTVLMLPEELDASNEAKASR